MKIKPRQYAAALYEAVKGARDAEIENMLENFVDVIKKNNDLSLSDKIINEYYKYYRQKKNISKIEIISSRKLNQEEINKIIKNFENKVEITEIIDKSIIDGIIVKIDDNILIDGSVKRKLENLKESVGS